MGSTEKMGAGTNVQRRLRAVHELDAPWRFPAGYPLKVRSAVIAFSDSSPCIKKVIVLVRRILFGPVADFGDRKHEPEGDFRHRQRTSSVSYARQCAASRYVGMTRLSLLAYGLKQRLC